MKAADLLVVACMFSRVASTFPLGGSHVATRLAAARRPTGSLYHRLARASTSTSHFSTGAVGLSFSSAEGGPTAVTSVPAASHAAVAKPLPLGVPSLEVFVYGAYALWLRQPPRYR